MLTFFAGGLGIEEGFGPLFDVLSNRLVSFHYMTPQLDEYYFYKYRDKFDKIILDSGAFSAWNAGATIDLKKYGDYILEHQDQIDYIVNLDVIPAKPGVKKIPKEEIERSASQGFDNYLYLLDRGVKKEKLIHVFHQNEDFKWLEKMLDFGMEYIGLSPANDRTTQEKMVWLDDCMKYVTNDKGEPIVKWHGFAVTSFRLMLRYPWYSVDSSTWATVAGRGVVFIPRKTNGKWDYTKEPIKLSMSQVTAKKDHLELQSKGLQQHVLEYLKDFNLHLGESEFVLVDQDYQRKENEKPCPPKYVKNLHLDPPPEGKKWIERVHVDGIMNNWRYRMYLNAVFLKRFSELKPKPEIFKYKKASHGFGLV